MSGCGGDDLFGDLSGIVDEARQLVSDAGLRPYRIFSVLESWTGGRPGVGELCRTETEWLPTPVLDFRSIRREYKAAGSVERGSVRLRKVSPNLTEAEIRRLCSCDGRTTSTAIIEERKNGGETRRFIIDGAPYLDAERFEWIVPLRKQDAVKAPRKRTR